MYDARLDVNKLKVLQIIFIIEAFKYKKKWVNQIQLIFSFF